MAQIDGIRSLDDGKMVDYPKGTCRVCGRPDRRGISIGSNGFKCLSKKCGAALVDGKVIEGVKRSDQRVARASADLYEPVFKSFMRVQREYERNQELKLTA